MTTPRDLMISALDAAPGRPVMQGELSLALAGAELIDLLAAGAVALDGDRILPGPPTGAADPLADQAAASLVREAPYESVADWLWRRGRGLATAYLDALEAEGRLVWRRSHWRPFQDGRTALADSPDRRRAADRRASDEPVLAALVAAVGIRDEDAGNAGDAEDAVAGTGEAVQTVLAAVNDALMELAAVRQRRAIEQAAFDNIWRGA
ncbi:GPP34 family phosphoprotein [Streptomyces thioluteus]|uniref:GPP34 family phosphoprotein n=1 Tax=Streptomyces thioluteus TaxID=66431 RepID=A0ABN3WT90_STRTU